MPSHPVDFTNAVTILVAGALLMVPVLGFTLRLTVPPVVESFARATQMAHVTGNGTAAADGEASTRELKMTVCAGHPIFEQASR